MSGRGRGTTPAKGRERKPGEEEDADETITEGEDIEEMIDRRLSTKLDTFRTEVAAVKGQLKLTSKNIIDELSSKSKENAVTGNSMAPAKFKGHINDDGVKFVQKFNAYTALAGWANEPTKKTQLFSLLLEGPAST